MLETKLGGDSITAEQQSQFLFLHEEVLRLCRLAPIVSRGTQTLQEHVAHHEESLLGTHAVNSAIERLATSVAKPVEPSRAQIPVHASQVLPELHPPERKAK